MLLIAATSRGPDGNRKPASSHCGDKFECTDTGTASECKYRTGQWLQMRRDLAQSRPEIGRSVIP